MGDPHLTLCQEIPAGMVSAPQVSRGTGSAPRNCQHSPAVAAAHAPQELQGCRGEDPPSSTQLLFPKFPVCPRVPALIPAPCTLPGCSSSLFSPQSCSAERWRVGMCLDPGPRGKDPIVLQGTLQPRRS